MPAFNLLTMLGNRVSGIEPVIAGDQDDAIAYSCGVLTERTKMHAEMYANLGVRWVLDAGDRSLNDAAVAPQKMIGTWRLAFSGSALRLIWTDHPSN